MHIVSWQAKLPLISVPCPVSRSLSLSPSAASVTFCGAVYAGQLITVRVGANSPAPAPAPRSRYCGPLRCSCEIPTKQQDHSIFPPPSVCNSGIAAWPMIAFFQPMILDWYRYGSGYGGGSSCGGNSTSGSGYGGSSGSGSNYAGKL